jgi:hypothetical protein
MLASRTISSSTTVCVISRATRAMASRPIPSITERADAGSPMPIRMALHSRWPADPMSRIPAVPNSKATPACSTARRRMTIFMAATV